MILERQISASSDDCYTYNGNMSLKGANIYICRDGYYAHSYVRFKNISIPPGSIIENAHLEVCASGTYGETLGFVIHGIKEPNTATFSTAIDADSRPLTDASISWILGFPYPYDPYWAANTWHGAPPDGPDLKTIIQEQINQAGWIPGNALAIRVDALNNNLVRSIWAYDSNPALAAKLVITYTPPSGYTLTISTTVGGTTNPVPGSWSYYEGEVASIIAIPNSGYRFVEWQENGVFLSSEFSITLIMNANRNITAIFELIPSITYNLNISATLGGTTSPTPGLYSYEEGTTAVITAIPGSGYQFARWEEGGVPITTSNPLSLLMNADRSIVAVFEILPATQFTVSVSVSGQGTTNPSMGSYLVTSGAIFTITAYPSTGWLFSHWAGDVSGTTPTIDIEVLTNLSIVAVFVQETGQIIELDRQIAASTDDCFCTFPDSTIRLTTGDIFISECTHEIRSYFRFRDIRAPQGAVIIQAYLDVCAYGFNAGNTVIDLYGIKEPNTAAFSTAADADARPVTSVHADWDFQFPSPFDPYWDANTWHGQPPTDGPELKDIIQEIVNQPDWLPGNALAIKGVSIPQGGNARCIWAWDGDPTLAAKLHIEYAGQPVGLPPSQVVGVNASHLTQTSVSLAWNPNPSDEGVVFYRVYLRKV